MKYYLAGIKRENMILLAIFLSDLGYDVVGYEDEEFQDERLTNKNIEVLTNILDLNENCIVVYSDLEEGHRVFLKAKELNIKVYTYDEIIEKLSKKFETISISGCHGKTTVANILKQAMDSNYIIGNDVSANKEHSKFVYEEDNMDRDYSPEYIIITSMEMRNTDNYKTVDDVINKYQEYANKANKMVIACGDDPYTHTLDVNTQIFYYGLNEDNDITARDIEYTESGTIFDVYVEDEYYGHFDLPIYGKYMLLDTLAAIAICHYERIDAKDVSKRLKEIEILKEELIGSNIIIKNIVRDEIEVKVLLKSIKQKYVDKRILLVNYVSDDKELETIKESDINKYTNSIIIKLEG